MSPDRGAEGLTGSVVSLACQGFGSAGKGVILASRGEGPTGRDINSASIGCSSSVRIASRSCGPAGTRGDRTSRGGSPPEILFLSAVWTSAECSQPLTSCSK